MASTTDSYARNHAKHHRAMRRKLKQVATNYDRVVKPSLRAARLERRGKPPAIAPAFNPSDYEAFYTIDQEAFHTAAPAPAIWRNQVCA